MVSPYWHTQLWKRKKSEFIDHYIVNTDSDEIADVAKKYGADVQFGRPKNLSDDTASSGETLKYAVERFENNSSLQSKIVVELMATNPLKSVLDIDGCIKKYNLLKAESVVAMGRLYDHHPSRIKFLDDNDRICDFFPEVPESRRQDLKPAAYVRAGSIYVLSRDKLRTGIRYGGNLSFGYRLPDERFLNIDEPRDLMVAETLLSI
jgi:CMP-N-acetylneuraminic acid synthetase